MVVCVLLWRVCRVVIECGCVCCTWLNKPHHTLLNNLNSYLNNTIVIQAVHIHIDGVSELLLVYAKK